MEIMTSTQEMAPGNSILTPDQRLRVFISSTIQELSTERMAVKQAIQQIQLTPILFELGARTHAPRNLYRQYLAQSHIFVGIYWNRYGWVAPDEEISGLEDEYNRSEGMPKLIYIKETDGRRDPRLNELLERIQKDDRVSYKHFRSSKELSQLVMSDLAVLLTERFNMTLQHNIAEAGFKSFHSIPAKANSIVGREREITELMQMLMDDDIRLITLTGPGGIGKTRLAVEIGQRIQHHFPHGVAFVPLAPVREASQVAETIAHHLGMKVSGANVFESLKIFLSNKRFLLILDNFEQVIQAAPSIDELLVASPGLEILVTSRERLSLSSEQVYRVSPLKHTPDKDEDEPVLPSAVQLFVQRAKAVQPSFGIHEENREIILAICRRLEGLPLAIELAASQINLFSPAILLQRLGQSLDVLKTKYRDIPERQRTLRNTIAWSYDLLNASEQEMLLQISVFPSGVFLNSLEAIPLSTGEDAYFVLGSLLDKSLLHREEETVLPRFQMLESVREFALSKLKEENKRDEMLQRQADYYAEALGQIKLHRSTSDQAALLKCLEKEHANIRQSLDFLMHKKDLRKVTVISWNLWLFWWVNAHTLEGYTWLKRAWILHRETEEKLDDYTFSLLAAHTGIMAFLQRDMVTFQETLGGHLALILAQDDDELVATATLITGVVQTIIQEYASADQMLKVSLDRFRKIDLPTGISLALSALGRNAIYNGHQTSLAKAYYKESMAIARKDKDEISFIITLAGFALCEVMEHHANAKNYLRESLLLSQSLHFYEAIAWSLEIWSLVSINENRPEHAIILMSGADHLRMTTELPVWDDLLELIQQAKDRVRQQMDAGAFEKCWKEGAAMNLEEMIQYALAEPADAGRMAA